MRDISKPGHPAHPEAQCCLQCVKACIQKTIAITAICFKIWFQTALAIAWMCSRLLMHIKIQPILIRFNQLVLQGLSRVAILQLASERCEVKTSDVWSGHSHAWEPFMTLMDPERYEYYLDSSPLHMHLLQCRTTFWRLQHSKPCQRFQ